LPVVAPCQLSRLVGPTLGVLRRGRQSERLERPRGILGGRDPMPRPPLAVEPVIAFPGRGLLHRGGHVRADRLGPALLDGLPSNGGDTGKAADDQQEGVRPLPRTTHPPLVVGAGVAYVACE
jgi:hypothetical protein